MTECNAHTHKNTQSKLWLMGICKENKKGEWLHMCYAIHVICIMMSQYNIICRHHDFPVFLYLSSQYFPAPFFLLYFYPTAIQCFFGGFIHCVIKNTNEKIIVNCPAKRHDVTKRHNIRQNKISEKKYQRSKLKGKGIKEGTSGILS